MLEDIHRIHQKTQDLTPFLKYLVFQIQGVKNLDFEISDSKYLVFRPKCKVFDGNIRYVHLITRFFIWNTKYFENIWQPYSLYVTDCNFSLYHLHLKT